MVSIQELEGAIKFGDDLIQEYKDNNQEVPNFIYGRITELHQQLIEALKKDIEQLKVISE